jgi:hypothetical protein
VAHSVEVATDRADHEVEEALQIVRTIERDAHDSTIVSERLHVHISLQMLAKLLLDPFGCRVRPSGCRRCRHTRRNGASWGDRLSSQRTGACLDLTHRELASDDLVGELELAAFILDREERSRVPSRYMPSLN